MKQIFVKRPLQSLFIRRFALASSYGTHAFNFMYPPFKTVMVQTELRDLYVVLSDYFKMFSFAASVIDEGVSLEQ